MTTPAPIESDDASGWKVPVTIVCTFVGCAAVVGLSWLLCRFCSATTEKSDDVESASAPPLPLEYFPDMPSILDVD